MFDTLICVVLFEPSEEDIKFWQKRSEEWQDTKFYIHDNSTSERQINFPSPNTLYSKNGINSGLSAAYNNALEYADKIEFMVIFDQDSRPVKNYIRLGREAIAADLEVSIIGSYAGISKGSDTSKSIEVNFLISSGSIYRVNDLNVIGGFDPYYFIDRVDLDVCRAIKQSLNKKILAFRDLKMHHTIGEQKQKFFIKYREHSRIRNYYMARNRMYYYRKYYPVFGMVYASLGFMKQLLVVLALNSQRIRKLRAIIIGAIDGVKGV